MFSSKWRIIQKIDVISMFSLKSYLSKRCPMFFEKSFDLKAR